ncbi:MAG: hypothetical protein JNM90_07500 [Burkholderiales bacterium]|nr:hypothetical protein [Burkholderiales bacterium]
MEDDLTPQAMARLIAQFAALGTHRTGSDGDEATSRWLAAWLGERGIAATIEPLAFPEVRWRVAAVEVDGARIAGTPLYDGGATPPEGIVAPLCAGGGDGIAVVADGAALDAMLAASPAARPRAAIAVSGDPDGHVVLRNAERIAAPHARPVLQVAARDAAPLRAAAAAGRTARLVVDRAVAPGTASNVVADLPVAGADGLVVLMTPKSGWFTCAAERGGGIAIALALAARGAAMRARRRSLRVLFTTGHELAHWGLRHHLEADPRLRDEAALWVHLGASIGARATDATRLFSREHAWRAWFPDALARHGADAVTLMDADRRPGGESREVFDRPFVSMAGHHRYFHSPQDVPEIAVDAARVARFGAAFAELMEVALGGSGLPPGPGR